MFICTKLRSQESSVPTPIISSKEIFNDSEIFVNELNVILSHLKLNTSPVKMPQTVNSKMRQSYVIGIKEKELIMHFIIPLYSNNQILVYDSNLKIVVLLKFYNLYFCV